MIRFLIVDDYAENLSLLRDFLETQDFEVESAINGKEALKIARENPPDMIISDILMPVMDGFSLCRECKSDPLLKSIPFIFYTATYTGAEDKKFALNLGAERFLIKPMDLESFTNEIHEVIEALKGDRLVTTQKTVKDEKIILKEYNETLIRKLESKIGELTKTNQLLENSLTECKQAMDVQKRNESLLRTTQRLAHIGGWEWNVEKQTMFWTEEMYLIHDFEPEDFVPGTQEHATRSLECYLPEDRPVIQDFFQKCVEKGQPYDLEFYFTTAKGRQLWIRAIAKPVFENGKVVRVRGTIIDTTESKRVREQLIHSNDLMDYVISHAKSAIAVHDKDLNYVYVSKRYLKEYKVKEQNVIGKHHYEVFPDLPQKWRDVHQRSLKGEVLGAEEDPYFREDGSVDWTRWECRPWYESSGSIGGIIIYTEVINEQKKIEEDLRNRGNFIESIVNLSPDIIYIYDLVDKKNVYVNNGIQTVLSYSAEELQKIGDQLIPALMHPDDLKVYFDETVPRYAKAKDKELIAHQYRMKHKNGHYSWLDCVELIYKRQSDGSPHQIFGVVHDITERKNIEQILRESEYQYRTTLDSMKDIIHVMDTDCCLILTNNEFKKEVMELSIEEELIGGNLFKLFPFLSETVRQEYQQVFEKGELLVTEENIKIQGKDTVTETRKIPILKNNRVIQIVTIVRDITEKKVMEEALKKSHYELEQKVVERTTALQQEIDERKQIGHDLLESRKEAEHANKAKSEFLSNLSHEFRTPMHQILSYSKFGVDKIDSVNKEKLLHYFSKIGTIGKNLLSLLNELLDLSKLESGTVDYDMQKKDLKQIIENVSNEFVSLVNEKGVILEIRESYIPTEVACDEHKMGQVVRNMISNAIKFTPKDKKISVSLEPGELVNQHGQTDVKTIPAIWVKVTDQGIGIPEDEFESVFDKFVQSSKTKTGAGGTGLGLSICKEIITAHKGKIWAENNPEGGTTFSFVLPYKQEVK
jgi:PAS domain S-box-containing protein